MLIDSVCISPAARPVLGAPPRIYEATEFGFNFGLGFPCSSQQLVDVFTGALDIVEWRS
jgi:hypothetical protein